MKKFFAVFAIMFCALVSFTACNEGDDVKDGVEQGSTAGTKASKYEMGITESDNEMALKVELQGAMTLYLFTFDADGKCVSGICEVTVAGYTTEQAFDSCNGQDKAFVRTVLENMLPA